MVREHLLARQLNSGRQGISLSSRGHNIKENPTAAKLWGSGVSLRWKQQPLWL
jgi:hypothetical protein